MTLFVQCHHIKQISYRLEWILESSYDIITDIATTDSWHQQLATAVLSEQWLTN